MECIVHVALLTCSPPTGPECGAVSSKPALGNTDEPLLEVRARLRTSRVGLPSRCWMNRDQLFLGSSPSREKPQLRRWPQCPTRSPCSSRPLRRWSRKTIPRQRDTSPGCRNRGERALFPTADLNDKRWEFDQRANLSASAEVVMVATVVPPLRLARQWARARLCERAPVAHLRAAPLTGDPHLGESARLQLEQRGTSKARRPMSNFFGFNQC
mmetsp:Transcript_4120/g.8800  ORF Transcript_4120/g.8800 Transcript_4120/m.8800 type:complete len:213 (+) Transcript_4120:940-1578(+)